MLNGLQISVKARQTLRARAKTGVLMTPPAEWDDWLTTLFPAHFKAGFAERHVEMWEWEESIVPGKRPRPFIALWPRGGAKSTSAEAIVVKLGAREVRNYAWYVSSIQDKADQHVASIGEMLETDTLSRYYPALASRRVGKYGASKGWRRERLSTDSGLTIDALGLDTGSRGAKIGAQRPDIICHEVGTKIYDGGKWLSVEDHPGLLGIKEQRGLEISLWGLPAKEVVTFNHKYWARYEERKQITDTQTHKKVGIPDGNSKPAQWVEASQLKSNHYIGLPIDYRVFPVDTISFYKPGTITERNKLGQVVKAGGEYVNRIPPEFLDNEWWWFIGLWWGDGHVAGKFQVGITIADTQPEIMQRVITLLNAYDIKFSTAKKPGCSQVNFSHAALNRWFRTWKTTKEQAMKVPPQWVEFIENDKQVYLARGYIDSDGFIDFKNKQVRVTSVSLDGLLAFRRILARLGIAATIRRGAGPRIEKFVFANGKVTYSRSKQKYDIQFRDGVKDALGIDIPDQTRYDHTRQFIKDGYLWSKIRSVSQTSEPKKFAPIRTTTGTYVTHFGLSHNCLDDVDELGDSLATVLKKIDILTKTILPAGSSDCAILFIQNLIHPESIASRLVDGRADFLSERIISGPYPAIEGLAYEQRGGKFVITAGKATWEGQSLKICQQNIWDWGLTAFLQEAQHDIDRSSGLWSHIDFDSIHVALKDMPPVIRTVVWVDPAVTSTDESDNQGIQADSLCADGRIYRRFSWEGIDSPENTLEHAIKKAIELHADTVGVEDDQGGDTWQSVYKIACREIKKEFRAEGKEIREFPRFAHNRTTDTKNEQRVETGSSVVSKVARNSRMLTAYENDKIRHVLGTHTFLERALNRFPRKPLDLVDASFWSWRDLDLGLSIVGEEELKAYGKDEIAQDELSEDMVLYRADTYGITVEQARAEMMKEREKA